MRLAITMSEATSTEGVEGSTWRGDIILPVIEAYGPDHATVAMSALNGVKSLIPGIEATLVEVGPDYEIEVPDGTVFP
jgi:hypothetical protein